MNTVKGGVTAAKGFKAAAAACGIKYTDRLDMALVYSECPAVCAGTFTKNVVKAAPVKWDKKIISEKETIRAVVLNSGIANACTGKEGIEYNEWMAKGMADELGVDMYDVCTASTGVIGMQLVKEPMKKGFELLSKSLSDSEEAATLAARAIMTTDTVSKEAAVSIDIGGKTVTIGGMSKGSGMIHPNMATMLCVITTDAVIEKSLLQKAVSDAVNDTFNMISVDRDTSTNDSVIVMANGKAENETIKAGSDEYAKFYNGLKTVADTLAKLMASDGEGATKLFAAKVTGAKSKESARILAKSVITSNLVKTAVYGSDANWGRILCALGYSGEEFDPEKVDLYIESVSGKLKLVEDGMSTGYSEEYATKILSDKEVTAICDMKSGEYEACAWGCDLTYDYVKINGDYRS